MVCLRCDGRDAMSVLPSSCLCFVSVCVLILNLIYSLWSSLCNGRCGKEVKVRERGEGGREGEERVK